LHIGEREWEIERYFSATYALGIFYGCDMVILGNVPIKIIRETCIIELKLLTWSI